jgi:toxin ParE1/3/4
LSLSPRADDDLADILQYTAATWGQEQADAYQSTIYEALKRLVEHPELGQIRDELRPRLRSLRVEQHIVYYRVEGDLLRVSRILHRRRNTRHQPFD